MPIAQPYDANSCDKCCLQDCPLRPIGAPTMNNAVSTLIPLSQVEPAMIEQLLDRAFGGARHGRTAYKVRQGTQWLPALSFAALDEDEMLVATIQAWPVALMDDLRRPHPMLMIGPVAVLPEFQGQGYGRALMAAQLGAISSDSPLPQMLIGDPEYYGRFGFTADPAQDWRLPGAYEQRRLLVRAENPAVLPKRGILGPWLG